MLGSLNPLSGLKRLREHEAVHHLSLAVRCVLSGSGSARAAAAASVSETTPERQLVKVMPPGDQDLIRTWSAPEFIDSVRPCLGATRLDLDALFLLRQLAHAALPVAGDFVEFGTERGGTAWLLASAIAAQTAGKRLHLLGAFAGSAAPSDSTDVEDADSTLAGVQTLLGELPDISYYPGPGSFGDRFAKAGPTPYAFAHIDCQTAELVTECCSLVYPHMSAGGFLVFANYGLRSHPEITQAVDDFFANQPEQLIRLTSPQAVVCVLQRPPVTKPLPPIPPPVTPAKARAKAAPKRKGK